ncbi:transposase [Mesorhizobium sp. M0622]|uniref:transposase n=1 Tax=Mesorhizobium sp. M0622 TaxID=2956975 RepID=UPI00333519A8
MTGPERRRWSEEDQCRILAAAFAPGSTVAAVARQYNVATSLIYKWRRTVRTRETGFAEVACCRFRGHRDKVFNGTGEWKCREGSSAASSSLRQ